MCSSKVGLGRDRNACRLCRGEGDAAAVVCAKICAKISLSRVDERLDGAEVRGQRDRVEEERYVVLDFEAGFADAREELGVGVAEKVNGLHRIADDEATAAFALGPRDDEAAEEFVLAAAGVLKLVDEEVANAIGDGERGVGGLAVGSAEDARAICATST